MIFPPSYDKDTYKEIVEGVWQLIKSHIIHRKKYKKKSCESRISFYTLIKGLITLLAALKRTKCL